MKITKEIDDQQKKNYEMHKRQYKKARNELRKWEGIGERIKGKNNGKRKEKKIMRKESILAMVKDWKVEQKVKIR